MCGRYEMSLLPDNEGEKIKEKAKMLKLTYKEGEIFPSDEVLCVIPNDLDINFTSMKWGINNNNLQINARIESIDEKPMYKHIKNNRCAVIANGFYEWDKNKRKYYVKTKDKYIYFACVFNDKKELLILTKEAGNDFTHIHNRIPIIMNKEEMLNYIHNKSNEISKKELIINDVSEQISLF